MAAYYNEHDPFAADWLENLILVGAIAPGVVDRRSIEDVAPSDLAEFTQCHFFAGIGGWSLALRQAGWTDDRPVWTGSCPCQPFSSAGKGVGFDDERHLWPALLHLITLCDPGVVFGEQVASKDGLAWLDLVHADMEATGRAFGALDLCAAGIGAPHIRQRSFWMAHRDRSGLEGAERSRIFGERNGFARSGESLLDGKPLSDESLGRYSSPSDGREQRRPEPSGRGVTGRRGDLRLVGVDQSGPQGRAGMSERADQQPVGTNGLAERLADDSSGRSEMAMLDVRSGRQADGIGQTDIIGSNGASYPTGPTNGFWRDADWLGCRDDKWRPVEPGTFPLAHGVSNRVGSLRGYGNAIVVPLAQIFIETAIEYLDRY